MSKKDCAKILDSLASIATQQVKKVGKVTIPGLFMVKTRVKPATKAGKREVFGKVVMVKAKPAKTVVKGYCVGAPRGAGPGCVQFCSRGCAMRGCMASVGCVR